ncbi:MAG: replication-associated recombination protein A [Clostridia bacterium]|nr:replication-associated recombination protein A [Clostridia bacterium]
MLNKPLADAVRPRRFDEIVGQKHLFGENGAIRRLTEGGRMTNMIFFGPPGTGKTTAARIIAQSSGMDMRSLNATSATLADVREVIDDTKTVFADRGILLYLDEIQYFNKKQQQSLLEYIEDGRITLIASTTENPYLYVYNAIISRSAVFEFYAVKEEDIVLGLRRALDYINCENGTDRRCDDDTLLYIARIGAGDVRRSITYLENAYYACDGDIIKESLEAFVPAVIGNFDRNGTVHYDLLSAIQKSIRGSDPDATAFYVAKALEGGDLVGVCRRLQVIASEDIGLAYPMAPVIVRACVESAFDLGLPEGRIPLINAALTLATAPKSNSAYTAYNNALSDIQNGKGQTVPPYMRPSNNYRNYKYPHEYPNHWVKQQYLPEDLKDREYYKFGENKVESAAKAYWDKIKGKMQ